MSPDLLSLAALLCVLAATSALRLRLFRPTTHGSARWGKPPRTCLLPPQPGGVQIGHYRRKPVTLTRETALQHGLIIGGTGTGKSRGYFLPNAAALAGTSLVCTDPKGELWRTTAGFHNQALRFAPADPATSACFNWIPLCREARIAELCARAIVESGNTARTEQVWIDLETAFLSALFAHAATLPAPTPLTAYRLFTGQTQEALLDQLLHSDSQAAQEQALIFAQTDERLRGSIVPVLAAKLQFLRDEAIARFTSASLAAPDFGRLREEPAALYWCLKEGDIARLRPLTCVFFSLLLEQIAGQSDDASAVPITLLLDEFANIGVIPHFETTISVVRGRGISLWLGIQSLSQLEARYGKANSQTIITNCATKIALHGLDIQTAKYLSETLGEATVSTSRQSVQRLFGLLPAPSVTVSDQQVRRSLLTPDEVRRIPADRAIVIVGNQRPLLLTKRYYAAPARTKASPTPPLGRALASLPQPALSAKSMPPPFPKELRTPLF